jgi:hypothetical protein
VKEEAAADVRRPHGDQLFLDAAQLFHDSFAEDLSTASEHMTTSTPSSLPDLCQYFFGESAAVSPVRERGR